MLEILKLIEARASRREQYCVSRPGAALCFGNSSIKRAARNQFHRASQLIRNLPGSRSNQ
jgi:hypothetical protein